VAKFVSKAQSSWIENDMQTAVVAFWEGRIWQRAELFRVPDSCPKIMLHCGLDMKFKNPYFTQIWNTSS
jgi:hypothetical protein